MITRTGHHNMEKFELEVRHSRDLRCAGDESKGSWLQHWGWDPTNFNLQQRGRWWHWGEWSISWISYIQSPLMLTWAKWNGAIPWVAVTEECVFPQHLQAIRALVPGWRVEMASCEYWQQWKRENWTRWHCLRIGRNLYSAPSDSRVAEPKGIIPIPSSSQPGPVERVR